MSVRSNFRAPCPGRSLFSAVLSLLSLVVLAACDRGRTETSQSSAPDAECLDLHDAADAVVAVTGDAEAEDATTEDAGDDGAGLTRVASDRTPKLAVRGAQAWVLAEPKAGATRLGYLRAGTILERDEKASSDDGCRGGWFGVRPKGFVCVGDLVTLDLHERIARDARFRPDRRRPFPYGYGIAKNTLGPFYTRVPTPEESKRLEADYDSHLRSVARTLLASSAAPIASASSASAPSVAATADRPAPEPPTGLQVLAGPPDFLADGGVVPNVSGLIGSRRALWAGRPKTKEGFAILARFPSGPGGTPPTGGPSDRLFDLTTDYLLLPTDRLRNVNPSTFHGIALEEGDALPVAFVRIRHRTAKVWLDGDAGRREEVLEARTAVKLAGTRRTIAGVEWAGTQDGAWVKAQELMRVEAPKSLPAFARKGQKWIDVSIARQSLVAWEGERPVYATLVSTGRDGLGDPESTHATVRGVYRIHTKHISATMDSTEVGEEFSLRDVPYVQYFETGYALHGVYWHDGFGEPRSHGCINLAPIDAQWLFAWTGPEVPEEWHGAFAHPMSSGTPLWIHP